MKFVKLLLPLLTLSLLTSCGGQASVDSSSENNTSDSSLTESVISPWGNDLANLMKEILKEEIPFIQMDKDFKYKEITNQNDERIIYIYEDGVKDHGLTEMYKSIVENAGFTFVMKDEQGYYNYMKDYVDRTADLLRFGYFPGDENEKLSAGFEIYAARKAKLTYQEEWNDNEKEMILNNLGEMIPCPKLSSRHETYWDSDINALVIRDLAMSTGTCDAYLNKLREAGFSKVEDSEYQGFYTYERFCEGSDIYKLEVDPYDYNKFGQHGVELYVRRLKDIKTSPTWPKDEISSYYNDEISFKNIPEYTFSDKYIYYKTQGIFTIKAKANSENVEKYFEILRQSGYYISYNLEFLTYRAVSFDEKVILLIQYVETNQTIKIEVNQMSRQSYFGTYNAFPSNEIKTLLGLTKDIPVSEGDTFKLYDHSELGYIKVNAIDVTNKIALNYKTSLETLGLEVTIDENNIYHAIISDCGVSVSFISSDYLFQLQVSKLA